MIDIQDEKIRLIKHITELNDAQVLRQIREFIQEMEDENIPNQLDLFELSRNEKIAEEINLEMLAEDQGHSANNFFSTLDAVDHQLFSDQTLEELLATLSN